MTIILFLVDTSASMNQRTYLGARKTLLDVAKDSVEKFIKTRTRDIASRGDRYMLLTFEDPPHNIKAGWKESHLTFMNELKHLTATGVTSMGPAIKNAFDLLNLNRMQSGIDMYGLGRAPYYFEPAMLIVITDGSLLTNQMGVPPTLELPMQVNAIPGAELTVEPFRWDQRLYSLVLRLTGSPPSENAQANQNLVNDYSPIGDMCRVTAGRSYSVTSKQSIMQSIESLVQKIQSGVVVLFKKVGPDPPPIEGQQQQDSKQELPNSAWHTSKCLIHVTRPQQKNFPVGHWPIPESYWPDASYTSLPPRSAHPHIIFSCGPSEPHTNDTLPFDKYELESGSPLAQYILSRKQPHVAWQVFIQNSGRQQGELGAPFGYLKASSNLMSVNLFVLPYNYPVFFPIIEDILKKPQFAGKPPRDWRPAFDEYLRTTPPYYINPLRRVLSRIGALSNLITDHHETIVFSHAVHTKLKNYKNDAKIQSDRLMHNVQHASKGQLHDSVRVLQCGENLRSQVESTSFNNMECTGRPTCTFQVRYNFMKNELNEFPNYMIRVRDRSTNYITNENLRIKHTFRNPYDIDRKDLMDQIHLMRANFMQSQSRIKFKDEDQTHTLPVAQMGNYQDYLKRQPVPLREIESSPVRQHMFGNPFKIDKKGMMVDEADNLGVADNVGQSRTAPSANQRRRGPIPRDFILITKNSWRRSSTGSPGLSPVPSDEGFVSAPETPNDTPRQDSGLIDQLDYMLRNSDEPVADGKGILDISENDIDLRAKLFKCIRGPGINYAEILKTIETLQGEKRRFMLDETIREAKRFKKVRLLQHLNSLTEDCSGAKKLRPI